MTVSSTPSVKQQVYAGPGDYSFPFLAFEETDLVITHLDEDGVTTELELTTDYTVVINSSTEGGTVTMINPSESGGTLIIDRILELSQEDTLSVGGDFDVRVIERNLDRTVMILQQFERYIVDTLRDYAWRNTWATGAAYVLRDIIVAADSNVYICTTAHTAGTFVTDLVNGKWALFVDVTSVIENTDAAEAAQAAAEAAQAAAEEALADCTDLIALAIAAEASAQGCVDAAAANAVPGAVEVTTTTTLSEAQCTNKYVSNYGAAGSIVVTLPAVSSRISFEFCYETAQNVSIVPPAGETILMQIEDLEVTAATQIGFVSGFSQIGNRFTFRRVRTGASSYAWCVIVMNGAPWSITPA